MCNINVFVQLFVKNTFLKKFLINKSNINIFVSISFYYTRFFYINKLDCVNNLKLYYLVLISNK